MPIPAPSPLQTVVAVDTTSRDESTELLREAFGTVVEAHGSTSFPDAVTLGLEHVGHRDSIMYPQVWVTDISSNDRTALRDLYGPRSRASAD